MTVRDFNKTIAGICPITNTSEKCLLRVLSDRMAHRKGGLIIDNKRWFYDTLEKWALDVDVSIGTIKNSIKSLEKKGLIHKMVKQVGETKATLLTFSDKAYQAISKLLRLHDIRKLDIYNMETVEHYDQKKLDQKANQKPKLAFSYIEQKNTKEKHKILNKGAKPIIKEGQTYKKEEKIGKKISASEVISKWSELNYKTMTNTKPLTGPELGMLTKTYMKYIPEDLWIPVMEKCVLNWEKWNKVTGLSNPPKEPAVAWFVKFRAKALEYYEMNDSSEKSTAKKEKLGHSLDELLMEVK